MDSVKLFFLNVFLYTLLLEAYLFLFLIQERNHLELPFITLFLSGVFTFAAVTVWINAAQVWHTALKSERRVLSRVLLSEAPFALLLLIILTFRWGTQTMSADSIVLMILFIGHLILFPLVMIMAKAHHEKIATL